MSELNTQAAAALDTAVIDSTTAVDQNPTQVAPAQDATPVQSTDNVVVETVAADNTAATTEQTPAESPEAVAIRLRTEERASGTALTLAIDKRFFDNNNFLNLPLAKGCYELAFHDFCHFIRPHILVRQASFITQGDDYVQLAVATVIRRKQADGTLVYFPWTILNADGTQPDAVRLAVTGHVELNDIRCFKDRINTLEMTATMAAAVNRNLVETIDLYAEVQLDTLAQISETDLAYVHFSAEGTNTPPVVNILFFLDMPAQMEMDLLPEGHLLLETMTMDQLLTADRSMFDPLSGYFLDKMHSFAEDRKSLEAAEQARLNNTPELTAIEFKAGDKVQLLGAGSIMRVTSVEDESVACVWGFEEDGLGGCFRPNTLTLYTPLNQGDVVKSIYNDATVMAVEATTDENTVVVYSNSGTLARGVVATMDLKRYTPDSSDTSEVPHLGQTEDGQSVWVINWTPNADEVATFPTDITSFTLPGGSKAELVTNDGVSTWEVESYFSVVTDPTAYLSIGKTSPLTEIALGTAATAISGEVLQETAALDEVSDEAEDPAAAATTALENGVIPTPPSLIYSTETVKASSELVEVSTEAVAAMAGGVATTTVSAEDIVAFNVAAKAELEGIAADSTINNEAFLKAGEVLRESEHDKDHDGNCE